MCVERAHKKGNKNVHAVQIHDAFVSIHFSPFPRHCVHFGSQKALERADVSAGRGQDVGGRSNVMSWQLLHPHTMPSTTHQAPTHLDTHLY